MGGISAIRVIIEVRGAYRPEQQRQKREPYLQILKSVWKGDQQ